MSPSKSKNLTPSYAVIQGLYWMYFAAIMSFSGFFLLSGGFTNTQIGILAAIAGLLSAVLYPVSSSSAGTCQLCRPSGKPFPEKIPAVTAGAAADSRNCPSFLQINIADRSCLWMRRYPAPASDSIYQFIGNGKHQSGTFSQFWSCTWNGICRLCLYLLHSGDHYGKSRTCFHPDHCNCPYPAVSWYPYSFSIFQSKIRQHCHECSQKQLRQ